MLVDTHNLPPSGILYGCGDRSCYQKFNSHFLTSGKVFEFLTILGSFWKFFQNIFKILFQRWTAEVLVFSLYLWQQGDRFLIDSFHDHLQGL